MAVDIAEAVSETVDKIKSNGDNAKAYNVDISDEQQVVDFVSDIKEQFGRIDVCLIMQALTMLQVEFMNTR